LLVSRAISAIFYGLIIIGSIVYSPKALPNIFFILLWLIAIWEWSGFIFSRSINKILFTSLLLVFFCFLFFYSVVNIYLISYLALFIWFLVFVSFYFYPYEIKPIFIGFSAPLFLLPSLFIVLYLSQVSIYYLLSLFFIVWANDVGAYMAGKTIGKVKLACVISPNKTWEGAIGGSILALFVTFLSAIIFSLPLDIFIFLSLIVTFSSIIGDLFISMLKRNSGMKDTGNLLPSHGGILDRIDSILASSVFFFVGLDISGIL
tara:strand:+ start:2712 stop:3494 length:783 start_codon:yes stop_codon:yes gene_type:complete